jgi:5-methylcytosine-specific restriction endonuclease McrA
LWTWLTSAYFERIVFTPGQRAEVSVKARFFSGATRRAIEVRDQECQHPTCHEPLERCQCDHIVPWIEGGPTEQENAQLLCGPHNRQKGGRLPPDYDPPDEHPPDFDPPDELQEE